ncbi:hypothetical protein AB0903_28275 [Streptomyces sp. NPDC048389]
MQQDERTEDERTEDERTEDGRVRVTGETAALAGIASMARRERR